MGEEGAQLGSWGSMLEPVSVYAGHSVLLYSEDREKRKMKVISQQEGVEYSGYSSRFFSRYSRISGDYRSNGFVVTSVRAA